MRSGSQRVARRNVYLDDETDEALKGRSDLSPSAIFQDAVEAALTGEKVPELQGASVIVHIRKATGVVPYTKGFKHLPTALAFFFGKLEEKRSADAQRKPYIVRVDLHVGST